MQRKKMEYMIDHADIVVTHGCPNRCPFCIDKFIRTSTTLVDPISVERFMRVLKKNVPEDRSLEILFLGGEPTTAPKEHLEELCRIVRKYGFSPIISTNNPKKDMYPYLTEYFDWVQVTVHTANQIEWLKQYKDKINIKLSGDHTLTMQRFLWFIEATKSFKRRSISMYFTPDFKELCKDEEVWKLLDELEWKRNGSYLYTFYEGVRIKRCIPGETNIIDEPTVPKLYPNGTYNKTWCNEDKNEYLGEMIPQDEKLILGQYSLQKYTTKELLAFYRRYVRKGSWPYERYDEWSYDKVVVEGMIGQPRLYAYFRDIKSVLDTRPHIYTKKDRTKLRKQSARKRRNLLEVKKHVRRR